MNIQQTENNYLIPLYAKRDIALVRGEGVYLFDEQGNKYLDFSSNYGANVLGYGNENFTNALKNQLDKLTNCHSSFYNDTRARFLEKLNSIIPMHSSFICSTGTESTEAALKIARIVTGRTKIISARRAYHGRTMGSLSATAVPKYQKPFLPLVPDFVHVSYNDIQALKNEIDENTAAVILEPVQGEGGIHVPDKDYLIQVKKLCKENKTLLILDEVQTFLRTGYWLASQYFEVIPDIVCISKGLGNGFPVAITSVSQEVAEKIPKGVHGTTFGGNPLACQAALSTIEEVERLELLKHAQEVGEYLINQLNSMKDNTVIREVRGMGFMIGIELKQKAGIYVKKMQESGLLVMSTNNLLRLLPPLVVSKEEIDEGLEVIGKVLCD